MPARPASRGLALLALLLACALAGPGQAQPALTAELRLLDPVADAPLRPGAMQPVRLRVSLTDAATGQPVPGQRLMGWVRVPQPGDAGCARAAQNMRATRGTPLGGVDLNEMLVVALNEDASVTVADPRLNLRSSNLVAAHRLPGMPQAMAVDAAAMRVLLGWAGEGRIEAAQLSGPGRETLAEGLPGLSALAVSARGTIWAGTAAGEVIRLAPDGRRLGAERLGDGPVVLRLTPDGTGGRLLAFSPDGVALLADADTGGALMRGRFGGPVADVAAFGDAGLVGLRADAALAEMRFADAPDRGVPVQLGTRFARIGIDPAGQVALAHGPGTPLLAAIDLAGGRVVQSLALNGGTIADVAFTGRKAFVLSLDAGFLGMLDLRAISAGQGADLRRMGLGGPSLASESARAGPQALLVPLLPRPQVLAVDPARQVAWLGDDMGSGLDNMPPMSSVRLRGGVPRAVAVAERGFREDRPGVYDAVWAFAPGMHELVLTTGDAGVSTCLTFQVQGAADRLALRPVRMDPVPGAPPARAGQVHALGFRLLDPEDRPVRLARLPLLVTSLLSGWSAQVLAQPDAEGVFRGAVELPHPGPFAIQPQALPAPFVLRSTWLVEAQAPMTQGDRP